MPLFTATPAPRSRLVLLLKIVKNDSVEEWAGGIYCIGEYDNTIENEADRIIHSYINITKGIISHNYGTCGSGVTYARYDYHKSFRH